MKKLFLTVASLLMVGATYSQDIFLGPKIGVNWATLTGRDPLYDKKFMTGFNLGATMNISINDRFSIQPELFFSQQGYRADREIENLEATTVQTLNYIKVPVLARYTFGEGDLRAYVNLGPYLGFMVGGRERVDIDGREVSEEEIDFDIQHELNRMDFGIALGGGALFRAGEGDLMLDLRYGFGLMAVSDEVIFEAGRDANSVWSLSVGYLFPMGTP